MFILLIIVIIIMVIWFIATVVTYYNYEIPYKYFLSILIKLKLYY